MKTKRIFALLLSLLLALSVCACAPAAAPEETPAATVSAEPTAAPVPQEETAAYTPGTYEATVPGLWGDLTVETEFSEDAIVSVAVTDDAETPGVRQWPLNIMPERIVENQSLAVDVVAGASVTSRAILSAVANCVEQAGGDVEALQQELPAEDPQDTEYTADVIVVGGGGAGLSAATAASETGASVIVVEKVGFLGGNSIVAGGIYNCADPDLQSTVEMTDAYCAVIEAAVSEEPVSELHAEVQKQVSEQYESYKATGSTALFDSAEWHALQTWNGGDKVADLELVLNLTRNALDGMNWLKSMGWEVQNKIGQGAGSLYMRTHYSVLPNTTGIIKAFIETLQTRDNVQILYETPANELIVEDGRVTGVKATAKDGSIVTLTANSGVVLATGGFAGNVEMRQQYCEGEKWPDLGTSLNTTNMPADTGDGIRMAEAIGADLVDMDQIQLLHTTNPITGTTGDACMPKSTAGAIFVNQDGNRFWREDGRRDDLSIAAMAQNENGIFWVVESADTIPSADEAKTLDGRTLSFMLENHISDYVSGNTLEELAETMGVNVENFVATVENYNAHVESGEADEFGRTLLQYKLETGPFYAFTRAPSAHHTMGGVHINTSAEVIDTEGNVIPGLYAAGEVTGGIHGGNRLGGNAIVDFVVYGRIAGTSAAQN